MLSARQLEVRVFGKLGYVILPAFEQQILERATLARNKRRQPYELSGLYFNMFLPDPSCEAVTIQDELQPVGRIRCSSCLRILPRKAFTNLKDMVGVCATWWRATHVHNRERRFLFPPPS